MIPHAFCKGRLAALRPRVCPPQHLCAYCGQPFPYEEQLEYCSTRCAEDHDTVLKGGTPLPEHERCTCSGGLDYRGRWHAQDCPRYVPHPEDYTHPLENE